MQNGWVSLQRENALIFTEVLSIGNKSPKRQLCALTLKIKLNKTIISKNYKTTIKLMNKTNQK